MDNKLHPALKPPISYWGGKQSIIRHMLPMVPEHRVYTEAFFGGGTLFFAKRPAQNETINDRLDLVVNFYRVVKTDFRRLKKMIDRTLISRVDKLEAQKIIRDQAKASKVELAWAAWFLFNFSFGNKCDGGLKYSNHSGTCVPDQLTHKKARFTDHLVSRIEHAVIENRDAVWILKTRNTADAFHEIDPPYMGADQGHYKGYTENEFIDVLDWCAHYCKGKFLLHNYNSDILSHYIQEYGWHKKEVHHRLTAPRKSGPVKCEVMVYNYNVQPTLFTL